MEWNYLIYDHTKLPRKLGLHSSWIGLSENNQLGQLCISGKLLPASAH